MILGTTATPLRLDGTAIEADRAAELRTPDRGGRGFFVSATARGAFAGCKNTDNTDGTDTGCYAAPAGLTPVVAAELQALLGEIEAGPLKWLTPELAAVRLRAIADALDARPDARAALAAEAVARVASRPLLLIAAAVAIAAINVHDARGLQ